MSDAYIEPLPGETLSAHRLSMFGVQRSYTPTLTASTTDPTLGTGSTATADYILRQGFVKVRFFFQFGTAGVAAGSGTYQISLPTGLGIDADWASQYPIGLARIRDSSVPTIAFDWRCVTDLSFADKITIKNDTGGAVTSSVPWTWAASDSIQGVAEYKTDFT
jgi:hypothetical protein